MTHNPTPPAEGVSEALNADIRVRRVTPVPETGDGPQRFEIELERDEPVSELLRRLREAAPALDAAAYEQPEELEATPETGGSQSAGPRSTVRQTGILTLAGPPYEVVEAEHGPTPPTLGHTLVRAAERHGPDRGVTVVDSDGAELSLSWGELLDTALLHAERLRESGAASARVLLATVEPSATLIAFWSCVMADLDPVLVPADLVTGDADSVEASVKALHSEVPFGLIVRQPDSGRVVGDTWDTVARRTLGGPAAVLDTAAPSPDGAGAAARRRAWRERRSGTPGTARTVAFMTSGSTGNPKVVAQRHAAVLSVAAGASWMNRLGSDEVSLNWMPLSHVGGILMTHVRDAYLGARHITVETGRILADPEEWFRIVHRERVTATWSPNFALKALTRTAAAILRRGQARYDLSSLGFYLNGGEAVSAADVREFDKGLSVFGLRPGTVAPAWGMTETCSGVLYNTALDTEGTAPGVPSVGFPVPGMEVRVVPLEEQQRRGPVIGHLEARGPAVLERYEAGAPESGPDAAGWFRTGDLGWIAEDGLHITGRDDSRIVVNGVNWNAADIESQVERVPGVAPGTAAVVGQRSEESGAEEFLVFCAVSGTDPERETAASVRDHLFRELRLSARCVVVVPESAIERTPIGKIKKNRLVERFARGSRPDLAPPAPGPGDTAAGTGVRGAVLSWSRDRGAKTPSPMPTLRLHDLGEAGGGAEPSVPSGERIGVVVQGEDLCYTGAVEPASVLLQRCARRGEWLDRHAPRLPRSALVTVVIRDDRTAGPSHTPTTHPVAAWLRASLNERGFGNVRMLWVPRDAPEEAVREAVDTADLRDRLIDGEGTRWVRTLVPADAAPGSATPAHYVLIGGTGRLGTALADRLLHAGNRVTVAGRSVRTDQDGDGPRLSRIECDIATEAGRNALGRALTGDGGRASLPVRLVHIAGSPDGPEMPRQRVLSDVFAPKADGVPNAIALARRSRVPLTVVSSVNAHIGGTGVPFYAAACSAAETAVKAANEHAGPAGPEVAVVVCSRIEPAEHRPGEAEIADLSGIAAVPLDDLVGALAADGSRPELVLGLRYRNRYLNAEGAHRVLVSAPAAEDRSAAPATPAPGSAAGADSADGGVAHKLREVVAGMFPELSVDSAASWFELGLTSVDLPMAAEGVSRETGVQVSVVEMMRYPSVAALAEAVERRLLERAEPQRADGGAQ